MWDHRWVPDLVADVLSRGAASLAGVALLVAATVSLMKTVVIPRALRSIISDAVAQAVVGLAILLSRLRRSYSARDSVLAWAGPTTIIMQLLTWLGLYLLAYGLLIYGVSGADFGESLRQAGSSLLTLGFAAVNTENQTIIDFMAAATGPIVIALLIGFLPTIYSAYLEREEEVTMLSSLGGEPAWGPELLARSAMADALVTLPSVFLDWSRWASRLRVTHITYPVLVWVRSGRATRHYVVALLAAMDAAALELALSTRQPRKEAFALLLQGGQAMDLLYISLYSRQGWSRLPFVGRFVAGATRPRSEAPDLPAWNPRILATQTASDLDILKGHDADAVRALARGDEQPLLLTRADFDTAVDLLQRSGFPIDRDIDQAWLQFSVARARYEFAAYQACYRLDATPAPWSGDRRIPTPTAWPTLAVDVLPLIAGDDPDAVPPAG